MYSLLCRSNMCVNVEIVCINSDYYKRGAFRALCVDDLLERERAFKQAASGSQLQTTTSEDHRRHLTPER